MRIIYRYDGGEFYPDCDDADPVTGKITYPDSGYTAYEIPDKFELTADQVLGADGNIGELLFRAGIIKQV